MAPYNGEPTHRQQVTLALVPKFMAAISIVGSSYIVWDCNFRGKEYTTYHRLLTGLSCCDICMSLGLFTTTWPMPKDTPNVWGAVGNVQTCEAIGFLEQWGVAAVLYNGSLSMYYLLRIKLGWNQAKLAKAEIYLHLVPLLIGLTTGVASLVLNLFNSGLFDCWIAPYPQGCQESWRSDDGTSDCIRGNNATLYQWIFDLIPKWSSIFLVTINMFLTHRSVLLQEQSTLAYRDPTSTFHPTSSTFQQYASSQIPPVSPKRLKPKLAKQLARQSYFYVGALYLTYIPVIITRATELIAGYVYYEMLLTISITIPLQGLWNVLVYLRPRYLRERERQRKEKRRRERQRQSLTGSNSSPSGGRDSLSFLNAISQAVWEGDIEESERDDDEDHDNHDINMEDVSREEEESKEDCKGNNNGVQLAHTFKTGAEEIREKSKQTLADNEKSQDSESTT